MQQLRDETTRDDTTVATERAPAGPWAGLALVLTGLFMISVDVAIVNVAAPRIERGLGVSGGGLVLVVSGYSVAYAVLLVTGARLGDDHGHRRVFALGLVGFTVASLMCGLAPTAAVLIVARVVQGASGAMMGPQVLSIIQTQFSAAERLRAVPLYATVLAAGAVVGQIAGGALVDADLFGWGWRPVFLVNVPIGVAVLAATPRLLPPSRGVARRRADPAGVVLVSLAVLALMLPLVFGPEQSWPAWTGASLAAGGVLIVASLAHLRRRAGRGGDPLVDLAIFRRPGVRRGLGALAAMQVAYGGFLFAFTLHLQSGLGWTPLRSGLTFAPFAAAFAVAGLGHPRLPARLQSAAPPAGLVVLAAGYVMLGLLVREGGWPAGPAAAVLVGAGAGFGLGFSPTVGRTVAATPARLAPEASALIGTTAQLGFATGAAVLGTRYLVAAGASTSGQGFGGVTVAAGALAAVAAWLAVRGWRAPG